MPKSTPPRRKKSPLGQFTGTSKVTAKPTWLRVVKVVGFTLLGLLMIAAMVGLILKHFRHA